MKTSNAVNLAQKCSTEVFLNLLRCDPALLLPVKVLFHPQPPKINIIALFLFLLKEVEGR